VSEGGQAYNLFPVFSFLQLHFLLQNALKMNYKTARTGKYTAILFLINWIIEKSQGDIYIYKSSKIITNLDPNKMQTVKRTNKI
jgi:hypothetical protein